MILTLFCLQRNLKLFPLFYAHGVVTIRYVQKLKYYHLLDIPNTTTVIRINVLYAVVSLRKKMAAMDFLLGAQNILIVVIQETNGNAKHTINTENIWPLFSICFATYTDQF